MLTRNQRFLRCCLVGLAGAAALLPALGWSHPQDTVPSSRTFEFTYAVQVPALPAGSHQLRLWVPLPRSDRYQKVSALRIESPVPYRIHRSEFGNRDAYFVIEGARARHPMEILVQFRAVRLEHRAELDPPGETANARPHAPADLQRFLAPDRMIPLSGIIAQLAEETTRGVTDPMEKARRIYEYVTAHMRYDKSGSGWGRGDAVWACSSHRGNCTDFHSLFIGMARAAGIPARFQIGFPLPEEKHEGVIPGYHCWAEFYLKGAGWVPVDASEAWLSPKRHDYYFGALDPSRVLFTRGRDLELSPPQKGEPLNYFIYPYAELDGKPFSDVQHKFSFRDLEALSGRVTCLPQAGPAAEISGFWSPVDSTGVPKPDPSEVEGSGRQKLASPTFLPERGRAVSFPCCASGRKSPPGKFSPVPSSAEIPGRLP